jgi:proton-coupled amino acid transporter
MAIYSFEGIAMAIPIEASMKRPEYFPIVWLSGCTFVTVLYTSFGAFVYACYGDAVPSIITLALPAGSMTAAVKISICISLILTYPLMMFPVFEIAEGHWAKRLFQVSLGWVQGVGCRV